MGIAPEANRTEAKDPPILQLDKKERSLPSTRNLASTDRARFLIILQTPAKNVQELAKEEREESEAKLREAIEISGEAVPAIVGS